MARVDVPDGEGLEASRMGRGFRVLDIARDFDVSWSREPKHPG